MWSEQFHFWLTCISNVRMECRKCWAGRPFSTNHLSYTKILVAIYIFRAITFLMVPPFFEKKWPFCPKIKTLSWAVFREALIVAPPFLDMCLDIYGAWMNQKISFDWDIILENIAFFAKNGFLKQKLIFVMDKTVTIKHFE